MARRPRGVKVIAGKPDFIKLRWRTVQSIRLDNVAGVPPQSDVLPVAKENRERRALALHDFLPWFVRFRTWPSGIDRFARQKWPMISIEPSLPSQLWRSDKLAKFEAQKLCIPFDGSEF